MYSTHGGRTRVRFKLLAKANEPKKCSAWLPNRPAMRDEMQICMKLGGIIYRIQSIIEGKRKKLNTRNDFFIQELLIKLPFSHFQMKVNQTTIMNRNKVRKCMCCFCMLSCEGSWICKAPCDRIPVKWGKRDSWCQMEPMLWQVVGRTRLATGQYPLISNRRHVPCKLGAYLTWRYEIHNLYSRR